MPGRKHEQESGKKEKAALEPGKLAKEKTGAANSEQKSSNRGSDNGQKNFAQRSFENQRGVKRENERHDVRGDAETNAGPAGFPKIRAGDSRCCIGRQAIGRRDEREHAEVEKKKMGCEGIDAELRERWADENGERDVDHRCRQRH